MTVQEETQGRQKLRPRPQPFNTPARFPPPDKTREQTSLEMGSFPRYLDLVQRPKFAFCSSLFFSFEILQVIGQTQPDGQKNYWVSPFSVLFPVM